MFVNVLPEFWHFCRPFDSSSAIAPETGSPHAFNEMGNGKRHPSEDKVLVFTFLYIIYCSRCDAQRDAHRMKIILLFLKPVSFGRRITLTHTPTPRAPESFKSVNNLVETLEYKICMRPSWAINVTCKCAMCNNYYAIREVVPSVLYTVAYGFRYNDDDEQ